MKKRSQHYVWRKYLEPWTTDSLIWCLRNGERIFRTNPINIGQQSYFYRLNELHDEDIQLIHKLFGGSSSIAKQLNEKVIELFQAPFKAKRFVEKYSDRSTVHNNIFKKLIDETEDEFHTKTEHLGQTYIKEIIGGNFGIIQEDNNLKNFLLFIVIQFTRTKRMQEEVINSNIPATRDQLRRIWPVLRHILARNIGGHIWANNEDFHFKIIENKSTINFITTDQPVINTEAILSGNVYPDTLRMFYPLSPKTAFLIEPKSDFNSSTLILNEHEIRHYNTLMKEFSYEQVYAKSKEELINLPGT